MSSPKPRSGRIKPQPRRVNKPSAFALKLLREWKRLDLPMKKSTLVVGVSGGADSVTLLLALDELLNAAKLELRIVVAHLNHKLRGKASAGDARWVGDLAASLGHPARIKAVSVWREAKENTDNVEQTARRCRYQFLEQVAKSSQAAAILAAHTLDDQAETVMLNLVRGSGTTGLSGIEAVRPINRGGKILLARPLLSWARRADTERYCRDRGIDFRLDTMNEDESFARVRVRKRLIPLLQSFNPRFVESIARTAEILREDDTALESAAARLLELSLEDDALRPDLLRVAPPALRRRALRRWISSCQGHLRRLEHVHVLALEKLLFNTKSGRLIELPGGARIMRRSGRFIYQHAKESAFREPS